MSMIIGVLSFGFVIGWVTGEEFIGWLDAWREKLRRRIWSDARPLVFTNACHSVANEPRTIVSYLDAFAGA